MSYCSMNPKDKKKEEFEKCSLKWITETAFGEKPSEKSLPGSYLTFTLPNFDTHQEKKNP